MLKVVPKVWGAEHWIVNRDYCAKWLYLKKDFQCSLHYHERKDETFYVMVGLILLELGDEKFVLKEGDSKHIPPGTKHRFTGIKASTILEISTHDDNDNVRLEPSKEVSNGSTAA